MWRLARAFELLEPLRKRIEAGMPAYGSCAGMIMLADRIVDGAEGQETIGGIDMTVRRNAFGRQVDSFETGVRLTGMGDTPYHAVFIRAPWVEAVGSGVEVLGRAGGGPNAGRIVAVRQGHSGDRIPSGVHRRFPRPPLLPRHGAPSCRGRR